MDFFKRLNRSFLNCLYSIVVFFAYNSKTFRRKRREEFGFPGKNYVEELKKTSKFLYLLEMSYHAYFIFINRNSDNRTWEMTRWKDYAPIYYRSRKDVPLEDVFQKFLNDAVTNQRIKGVLDIGCGGFGIAKKVAGLFPDLKVIGNDITDESRAIFNEISGDYLNIDFVKGSIFDHLSLLDEVDLFYSYNVFMHFDKKEIRRFFHASKICQKEYSVYCRSHIPKTP